jgi:hypothetical protein
VICRTTFRLFLFDWLREIVFRDGFPEVIVGTVPRDAAEPGAKTRHIPQGVKLAQRREENFLDQIVYFVRRHTREQNAMDHPGVAVVELAKGGAIAVAGCAYE